MEIMNGSLRVTTDIKWWSCSFVDGLHEKSMYTNIHRWVAKIYISTFYLQNVYVKYRFTSTTISQTYLNTKLKSNQAKHFLINQPNQYTPYLARSLFVWSYHHLIKIITSKYCVCCCIRLDASYIHASVTHPRLMGHPRPFFRSVGPILYDDLSVNFPKVRNHCLLIL